VEKKLATRYAERSAFPQHGLSPLAGMGKTVGRCGSPGDSVLEMGKGNEKFFSARRPCPLFTSVFTLDGTCKGKKAFLARGSGKITRAPAEEVNREGG